MRVFKISAFLLLLAAVPAVGQDGGYATAVETAKAGTRDLEQSAKAVGTLIADASATLRAEIAGQVVGLHFDEGQALSKGDRLYSLEATVLEAEVNEARANAERSKAALIRAEELFARKLISADDYDTARANYNVDDARLRSSSAILAKTLIRAPFDGFAGIRRINIGDYATVGQELVDVVKLDPLRVDFSLAETLLAKIRPGLAVSISTDAYPGQSFEGRITAVAPRADVAGHSIEVRASLSNSDLLLRPGLFVRVQVYLDRRQDAVVVPEEAIWPVGREKIVYVVRDGTARQRVVTLGERQPGFVEIVSGLDAGEVVVTAGQMKLQDGATVQPTGGSSAARD